MRKAGSMVRLELDVIFKRSTNDIDSDSWNAPFGKHRIQKRSLVALSKTPK